MPLTEKVGVKTIKLFLSKSARDQKFPLAQ